MKNVRRSIVKDSISSIILYILCFMPFVKFIPLGLKTDTQPLALMWAFLYILKRGINDRKLYLSRHYLFLCFYLVICAFFILMMNPFLPSSKLNGPDYGFCVVRNLITVGSIILITGASSLLLKRNGLNERLIKILINVWFVVGIVQRYFDANFLTSIVANARTSGNRGVVSLASEPSFYGYMCLLFGLFVYDFKKNRALYFINIIVQIIFLAKSFNTIILISVFVFFIGLKRISLFTVKKGAQFIAYAAMGAIISWRSVIFLANKFENDRIGYFLGILISNDSILNKVNLILSDGSASIRFNNIILPMSAFVNDIGMPHGLTAGRSMYGFASLLYQYGFFAIPIIIFIMLVIRNAYTKDELGRAFCYAIVSILFVGIQLNNPFLWFFLGYCFVRNKNKQDNSVDKENYI